MDVERPLQREYEAREDRSGPIKESDDGDGGVDVAARITFVIFEQIREDLE